MLLWFMLSNFHDVPSLRPTNTSPLSFRMSRADGLSAFLRDFLKILTFLSLFFSVLQSQLSIKARSAVCNLVGTPVNSTANQKPSLSTIPSPTTSLSSQGSIVLGHPPVGWQKKMMLSLSENTIARPKRLGSLVSSFPDHKSDFTDGNSDSSKYRNRNFFRCLLTLGYCNW
ncbi:hypothetical protein PsorP6_010349 [Peronosclerospora sorghi]|uniref:Uncharacterized protein n=1 Tax=Peronosclerospora sorghi TaxID=230839 RepID=A0ACC0VYN2_9STRA|nr:hypothetical protein PsorP6_010349 [Peronosclerospora sorghi]